MLLAFSPFFAFAVLERFVGVAGALGVAALLSLGIVLRDALTASRHVKLLEAGSLLLFGGLAALALATGASWPVLEVRLWVDLGLCVIILASILAQRPFTLAYAKERVPEAVWASDRFLRMNRTLSLAWLAAFTMIVLADLLMLFVPGLPLGVGIAVTVAALVAAFKFSNSYPQRLARKAGASGARAGS